MLDTVSLPRGVADFRERYVGIFCMAIWGAGQLVPLHWWYLHGITIGDAVFIAYFALATAFSGGFRRNFIRIVRDSLPYAIFIIGMIGALLFSLWLNSDEYTVSPYYVMSILRSGYFLLASLAVAVWAVTGNLGSLCKAYLAGLTIAWMALFAMSSLHPDDVLMVKCGYFVMHNPNVAGNMLGVAIAFTAILVIERQLLLAYSLSLALAYLSLYCFSKGAWGMVVTGLLALVFAGLYMLGTAVGRVEYRRTAIQLAGCVAVLLAVVIVGFPKISCLVSTKMTVQAANGSLELRRAFLLDSINVAMQKPHGVGIGRIADLPMYADVAGSDGVRPSAGSSKLSRGSDSRGFVGHSSRGNPHGAFLHLLAGGGFVALAFFVAAVVFPFYKLRRWAPRSAYLDLWLLFSLATFLISGSFQLQLFSQHFFWIFAGLLIALSIKYRQQGLQPTRL